MAKVALNDDDDFNDDDLDMVPLNMEDDDEVVIPDDAEVELVDDVPEKDRGRSVAADDTDDEPVDDDELKQYSSEVQKRINKLTRRVNDERRAKEAKERELNEAAELVRKLRIQNSTTTAEAGKKTASVELTELKRQYTNAVEEGDSEAQADLQEKMTEAKFRLMANEQAAARAEQEAKEEPQVNEKPQVSEYGERWGQANNDWFHKDPVMTGTCYGISELLVKNEGVVPDSKKYYHELDKRMRKQFPDYSWDDDDTTSEEPKPRKQNGPPIGGVVRTAPGGKKVIRLTPSQKSLCKRVGVSEINYAKELLKLKRAEGN